MRAGHCPDCLGSGVIVYGSDTEAGRVTVRCKCKGGEVHEGFEEKEG